MNTYDDNFEIPAPDENVVCFYHEYEENGCFSNWYRAEFEYAGKRFTSVEQYMMYHKVIMFRQYDLATKINYDVCIVGIGNNFQNSLQTTSLLKELGAKMVVSRAATDVQEKFLLRNGADEVVYPEKQLARWAAIRYSADHVLDYIELDSENAIFEVTIPQSWMGKTVGQLDIRKKFNINILGTKCGSKLDSFITPDTLLCEGKSLMVMGRFKDIQKCFRI